MVPIFPRSTGNEKQNSVRTAGVGRCAGEGSGRKGYAVPGQRRGRGDTTITASGRYVGGRAKPAAGKPFVILFWAWESRQGALLRRPAWGGRGGGARRERRARGRRRTPRGVIGAEAGQAAGRERKQREGPAA